ncbi:Transcription factor, MADS-box [Dillenia turbinata]|uniref:Transcription factor, MADS-box n=1 Tax=Dillenia turbinata TaxID=194707 RepID=A0AAN8YT63_9MAGN
MTRKKVKLAYIQNDTARKATFKKRKKGLMKKVSELSTLCGIEACALIYSPYEQQPDVWPSLLGAQHMLAKFKRLPEMDQSKKMMNQEEFMRQRILKARDQLKKQQKDNRDREMSQVMSQCLTGKPIYNMSLVDLNDLGWYIENRCRDIVKRLESLEQPALPAPLPLPLPPLAPASRPQLTGAFIPNLPMENASAEDSMLMFPTDSTPVPHPHPLALSHNHPIAMDVHPATVAGQRPPWTRDLMSDNEQMAFPGVNEETGLPYMDPTTLPNNTGMGPGPYLP